MQRWLRMIGLLILFSLFSYSTVEAGLVVEPTGSIDVENPTNYVVGNEQMYIGEKMDTGRISCQMDPWFIM